MSKNAVYFKSLTLENIKCFKEKQTIDLTNNNGEPAMWTVILGNNNTGKTTLLRSLTFFRLDDYKIRQKEKWETLKHSPNIFGLLAYLEKILDEDFNYRLEANLEFEKENIGKLDSQLFMFSNEGITGSRYSSLDIGIFDYNLVIYGYGTTRKYSKNSNNENIFKGTKFTNKEGFDTLFDVNASLINAEEWLIQTDYAAKNGAKKAKSRLTKIKQVLKDILPDVHDFKFVTNEETFESHVEVQTDFGWMRINDLGYGYQSLLAWVIDLAKKMFDRYPDSENPLHEPAIVLVDEIDLHLHPEWQRKIVAYLSKNFPKTQFIVTSHSPLVVQSADEVNVVVLKKDGDNVKIEQPKIENFQGWTVEEILRDLMDLDERTHSETYLKLRQDFDAALEEDNFAKAKIAKDELDKILHPNSTQRKILEIQMTSLTPELSVN